MASLRWTNWLVLLVHVLWASNIVAALPPPTYVYHVSGRNPSSMRRAGIPIQRGTQRWQEGLTYTYVSGLPNNSKRPYAPLGYQEVRQALRAWADPASTQDKLRGVSVGHWPYLYAIRPGPSTVNGPEDGSFYQTTGWPIDQIEWYSQLPDIGGRPPSQQAIHDISDEKLDQYIGRQDWLPNRIYCQRDILPESGRNTYTSAGPTTHVLLNMKQHHVQGPACAFYK